MAKTIFVLLDGCGFGAGERNLGYAEHLVEQGLGAKYCVRGELPSLSRPIYETLLTGLPVCRHGITNNLTVRRSNCVSVFDLCRKNGLKTAAAAYHWISELYVRAPFRYATDRIQLDSDSAIQNGIYYFEDSYPDSHVFADAEFLRERSDPDFLMVHSMNIDDAGHRFTSESREYETAAAKANLVLSSCMPLWMEQGFNVLITADHGMNAFGLHGGNTELQRLAPLYLFGRGVIPGEFSDSRVSQLCIAPLLCRLLGVAGSDDMKSMEEIGVKFFED
ncbi:MAG TPA: alkaline phosphatase family protein [Caproiciproducens sp.]|nr:alkaline phosphatase family protein [Caproiciproducens sp.]